MTIKGASEYNLKNIDADIPLGVLTCVTGVFGIREKHAHNRNII